MAKAKGKGGKGEFNVVLARIGEEARVYRMGAGAVLGDLLTLAGYNGDATDLRIDAKPVDRKTRLKVDDVVTIVPKVQGG